MKKPHRVKQETIHEMKIKTKNTYRGTQEALLQRHDRGRNTRTLHEKEVQNKKGTKT